MELRHLRYFKAIAQAGAIHRASEQLHITQPALSRQLADLEGELKVTLFERASKGLTLTPAGRAFLEDCAGVLGAAARAIDRARRVAAGELGQVRVGFIESAAWEGIVPQVFQAFRKSNPSLRLEAVPMSSVDQIRAIEEGRLDAGFLYAFEPPPRDVSAVEVRRDRIVLAVPHEWRSSFGRRRPRLAELAGRPFVAFTRSAAPQYFDHLAAACQRGGLSPTVVQEASNEVGALALVCAGIGLAFVNQANAARRPSRVSFVEVADLDLQVRLELRFRNESNNAALQLFVQVLEGLLRRRVKTAS